MSKHQQHVQRHILVVIGSGITGGLVVVLLTHPTMWAGVAALVVGVVTFFCDIRNIGSEEEEVEEARREQEDFDERKAGC